MGLLTSSQVLSDPRPMPSHARIVRADLAPAVKVTLCSSSVHAREPMMCV
jgi:hypothetical protein